MAIASFAPNAAVALAVSVTSSQVSLPTTGTPTIAVVTNIGSQPAYVALGSSSASVVAGAGMVVMPGAPLVLTIGANTNIAAITLSGATGLNIAVGN